MTIRGLKPGGYQISKKRLASPQPVLEMKMDNQRSPVDSPSGDALMPRLRWLDADRLLHGLSLGAVLVVFGMLIALVFVLLHGAMPSIKTFGLHFLTTSDWRTAATVARDPVTNKPLRDASHHFIKLPGNTYGALAVIYGTAVTSLIAMALAIPPSFAGAIFLVRVAPRFLVGPVSFLIEFLAAIPSLAYGLWGMFVLRPILRDHVEPALVSLLSHIPGGGRLIYLAGNQVMPLTGNDLLAGGVILGIMILPIITAVSRDVLRAVPRAQIEGSVALGATWWQSCLEMLKFSRGGLFGAVTLGLARAAGETMAVTMVIGITTQIQASPFQPAQTMSSLLAVNFGEVTGGLEMSALVEVALILLAMSLLFNLIARYLVVGNSARGAAGA
jgi:phosphate transport system permease protein